MASLGCVFRDHFGSSFCSIAEGRLKVPLFNMNYRLSSLAFLKLEEGHSNRSIFGPVHKSWWISSMVVIVRHGGAGLLLSIFILFESALSF